MDVLNERLSVICSTIVKRANNYAAYCNIIKQHPDFDKILNIQFLNERSIAHYIDVGIEEQLSEEYILSECKINNLISEDKIGELKLEIFNQTRKITTYIPESCIPDTVVIPTKTSAQPIFIEYKRTNSRFGYCELAIDYLKYKIYTANMMTPSYFIYVLLYGGTTTNNPNLINNEAVVTLSKILKKEHIYDNKSIFIFDSLNSTKKSNIDKLLPAISDAELALQTASSIPTTLNSDEKELKENGLYNNKGNFGNRVIIAKIIQQNFPEIILLYETVKKLISNGKIDIPTNNVKYDILSIISQDTISDDECYEIATHFKKQINKILNPKSRSMPKIFDIHKRKSVWILVLLQKFADNLDIDVKFENDLPKAEQNNYNILLSNYYKRNQSSLHSLCLALLYYIANLYPLIFEISNENKITKPKDILLYAITHNQLNKVLHTLSSTLNLKTRPDIFNQQSMLDFTQEIIKNQLLCTNKVNTLEGTP